MKTVDVLFFAFSFLTLASALFVVANPFSRNPVTSAMCLVLSIGSLAGLFVLLNAFFLAAVQVLVYAGAVMVLFLFVIMLLDLREEERRAFKKFTLALGVVAVAAVGFLLIRTILSSGVGNGLQPHLEGGTYPLGETLFKSYLLPFEVVSVLLLVAMVGAVLLSKKDLR